MFFFSQVLIFFKFFQMAWWFGFAAVAGAFGGLLAFGVQQIHSTVQNWRLLFIIEVSSLVFNRIGFEAFHFLMQGIPPVFLGIATIFLLPDRPESTPFLTEKERKLAIERMNRSTSGDHGAVVQKGNGPKLPFCTLINLSFLQSMFMRLSAIGGCVHRA